MWVDIFNAFHKIFHNSLLRHAFQGISSFSDGRGHEANWDGIQCVKQPAFIRNRRLFKLDDCKVHGFVSEESEKMVQAFNQFMVLVRKGTASVTNGGGDEA